MAFFDLGTVSEPKEAEPTKYWKKYEKGVEYLTRKQLVTRTNRAWNFFIGNQWEGYEGRNKSDLPSLPFIHSNIMRRVTTIYSNRMSVRFSDLKGRSELKEVYDKLTQLFDANWEKAKEDIVMRETLKNAAITGDGLQYFGTADVSDVQILQNTSVLYGDESEPEIQKQPYIIIHQREAVGTVRERARANGLDEEKVSLIVPDQDTDYIIGNREEVNEESTSRDSKVTTLIYMEKVDGVVNVAKCTKHVVYEDLHPIQGTKPDGTPAKGLTRYPIVKFSWELYPNDARGVSQVEQLIPNQLEINKTLARRSMTTKMTAYPRIAYDSNLVANPEDLEKVGGAIEVNTGNAQGVNQIISYLQPAQTNDEPKKLTDDILEITQELTGSGDTTMGNIDLQRVAASAIMAVNEKAESMHDETVARKEMATEDLALLWIELWQVYSPNGLEVAMETIDPMTGEMVTQMKMITSEELDQIMPTVRIDVSKDNSFTREAEQQFLDGLLDKQLIDLEEYTDLCTATSPVPINGLKQMFIKREAKARAEQEQMMAQGIPHEGMPPQEAPPQ
jgi:chemotaxis protein CheY-P-specific phosphatase CheC